MSRPLLAIFCPTSDFVFIVAKIVLLSEVDPHVLSFTIFPYPLMQGSSTPSRPNT